MMEKARTLRCIDCGKTFIFNESEERFFNANGWKDPIRCKACRTAKKEYRKECEESKYYGLHEAFTNSHARPVDTKGREVRRSGTTFEHTDLVFYPLMDVTYNNIQFILEEN